NGHWVRAYGFGVKEGIWRGGGRGLALAAERTAHVPEAEVEPRARIGQAHRLYAVEIVQRALETNRRRMLRSDRGIPLLRAVKGGDSDFARIFIENCHVHAAAIAPQPEQRQAAGRELAGDGAPTLLPHDRTRPRPMAFDPPALDPVDECGHDLSEQLRDVLEP